MLASTRRTHVLSTRGRVLALAASMAVAAAVAATGEDQHVTVAIDRQALVSRHSVRATAIDASSPLTVGNGEFAFTADVTGLQTLNTTYTNPPLQTMSHWSALGHA